MELSDTVDSSSSYIKDFQCQDSQVDMLLSVDAKIYDCDSSMQEDLHDFFHAISMLFNLYILLYVKVIQGVPSSGLMGFDCLNECSIIYWCLVTRI